MPEAIVVRHTRAEDIPALIALQARVYPTIPPWTEQKFRQQLEIFPQGQIVATLGERIVGNASSLIVLWDDWADEHTWKGITDAGTFNNHNPAGRTLYGAEIFVDGKVRSRGIGRALYAGRRQLCVGMNLKRIIACGRLPGYHKVAARMPPELYAKKAVWGDYTDPVLEFQLRMGFRFCGVVRDYLPEDTESGGHASLIAWLNPHYNPRRPTTVPERILP